MTKKEPELFLFGMKVTSFDLAFLFGILIAGLLGLSFLSSLYFNQLQEFQESPKWNFQFENKIDKICFQKIPETSESVSHCFGSTNTGCPAKIFYDCTIRVHDCTVFGYSGTKDCFTSIIYEKILCKTPTECEDWVFQNFQIRN